MKYITFNQLKIKNFLSVGEDEVVVDFRKGLHIITGINRDKEDRRNGVGKSTIADALYFAIFGTTLREIKKEYVVNNLTDGVCQVELTFNVNSPKGNNNFVIIRSINPSKLYVFKDGVDRTRDSIANTNEYIEAVLSSSPDVFQNCVIMTLNNTMPFMGKSKADKRKFIEQIFNLQIFSQMHSKLREEYSEVKRNHDIEIAKSTEVENSIITYQRQKDAKLKERENKVNLINTKIELNNKEIEKVNLELTNIDSNEVKVTDVEINKLNKAYDDIDEKIKKLIAETAEINSTVKQKQLQLSKVGTNADVCPTCLRTIDVNHREHIKTEKDKLQNEINQSNLTCTKLKEDAVAFKNKQIKIKNHISKLNDELSTIKAKLENKKLLQKRVTDLQEINKQLIEGIQNLNEQNDTFNELINETKTRLDSIKLEIENIKKTLNLLDVVKLVVSEEGVKSYIVKKILQNFNSKLSYYLKKLDSNSICVFNEYFEEEILNEKGKICSYNNFSGAERKAIDLACLFSFMDMRKYQGDVHYNISIYDELFDSSLDEKGVDLVLDILKERCEKHDECIFIISHRKESIKAATGDIIFLEKHNGITKRVNFVD